MLEEGAYWEVDELVGGAGLFIVKPSDTFVRHVNIFLPRNPHCLPEQCPSSGSGYDATYISPPLL